MSGGGTNDLSALSAVQNATLDELLKLPERQQLTIWRTLQAPAVSALAGEYVGVKTLEDHDAETWRKLQETFWNPTGHLGFWVGKAIRASGPDGGEGYNIWSRLGGRVRRFHRFATHVSPSLVDGKPSLHLQYAPFKNQAADVDLIDELRVYRDDIFMGIATRRAPDGGRTSPTVFLLVGPGTAWRGVDNPELEI